MPTLDVFSPILCPMLIPPLCSALRATDLVDLGVTQYASDVWSGKILRPS